LRNPKVWLMVAVLFHHGTFLNTNKIWFPTLLRGVGAKSVTEAGYILAGVWIFAAIRAAGLSQLRSRGGAEVAHAGRPARSRPSPICACRWPPAACGPPPPWSRSAAAFGYAVFMVFWTIPPVFLEARGAAMGIAMISALGQFGGLSGPAVVGWAFQETGSIYIGFSVAAATLAVIGTLLAVFAIPHTRLRKPETAADVSATALRRCCLIFNHRFETPSFRACEIGTRRSCCAAIS
jgi:hypothetical protein